MTKERKKAVFNWSGGKDSALALYTLMQDETYEITSLLTTVNRDSKRSSMHDIPLSLLERQAESIGLPLYIVDLASRGALDGYRDAMAGAAMHFRRKGVTHFVFGDIELHDVRSYREKQLAPYGIEVVEPLWGKSSQQVMEAFLGSGLQTVIVTVTEGVLSETLIGRVIDRALVGSFPPEIDICGENGEYHTLCYAGGMFRHAVPFTMGAPVKVSYPVKLSDGSVKEYTYWFAGLKE